MSEWPKEQFCTACNHLSSLSTFFSHPPALLQHLGKEGKLLNLKNLQGSCFTPALLPGWEFLIYSIFSTPHWGKLSDLTKAKWLHSGRGSSPSSWVQSLSARFNDTARYSEYALSWTACTQIFFLKGGEQSQLPVSFIRPQDLSSLCYHCGRWNSKIPHNHQCVHISASNSTKP